MKIEEPNKFGYIDPRNIDEFEETNDIKLPNDYKNFLLTFNGGSPNPNIASTGISDVQWIFGMNVEPTWASLFYAIETFQNRIPSWYFPIACDSGGNLYIMSLYKDNIGTIAFWDHENEARENADQYFDNVTFVASSFSEFINSLKSL